MHLARDFRSVLDELLARRTTMAVHQIDDGVVLEPNTVYVIKPGTEVEIVDSTFRVSARPAATVSGRVSSIDILLQSLAKSWREKAAAVILSGSGSDGAHGVMAIHAQGGLVLAQSPETAKFELHADCSHCNKLRDHCGGPGIDCKNDFRGDFPPQKNVQ